jgi:hypothetical protein
MAPNRYSRISFAPRLRGDISVVADRAEPIRSPTGLLPGRIRAARSGQRSGDRDRFRGPARVLEAAYKGPSYRPGGCAAAISRTPTQAGLGPPDECCCGVPPTHRLLELAARAARPSGGSRAAVWPNPCVRPVASWISSVKTSTELSAPKPWCIPGAGA